MSKEEMLFFSSKLFVSLLLSLLVCLSNAQSQAQNNSSTFKVGVVLDSNSLVGRIGQTSLSLALSDFYLVNGNYSTRLVLHVRDSKGRVIDAAATALSLLKDVKVDAIIGPQKSSQASFLIELGDSANVPIISFSATSPSLHSQSPYFFQAALNDAAQVGAIAAIVEYFHWSQVVLIYEESDYGHGIIPYLSNAFQDVSTRISYRSVIPISASDDFMLQELYKMKTMQTRVFVIHISSPLASKFFPKVKEAGMMSKGYVWIVTSGLMDLLYSMDPNVVETMEGVIGIKPLIPRSRKLISTAERWKRKFLSDYPDISHAELNSYVVWAYDTLWALATAAERVGIKEPASLKNNTTDLFTTEISQTGPKLQKALSEVTFEGLGGRFNLVNGQLQTSSFQILNVVGNRAVEVGVWTPSQGISSELSNMNNVSTPSNKMLKSIIFSGNSKTVPKGWEVPVADKKLRVGVPAQGGFPEFVKVERDPRTNASEVSGSYIDMFDAVMAALPYAVPYEYVPFVKPDGSSAGSYDELVNQVVLRNYDIAVGDITVTSKRSENVDFSLPFASGGVAIIVPIKYEKSNGIWFFLKPFTKELWLTIIAFFIAIGAALWILERRFNSAFRGPPSQHAGMILYFPFIFAQGERIVNNLARVIIVVWMLVILILGATYTANLSALLTIPRLQKTDVKELKSGGHYIGIREGSFLFSFVQGLGFDKSKIRNYSSPEDINEALTNGSDKGGISALFSVLPYSKLFLSQYCGKYRIVGQPYAMLGYAYALEKGSPLLDDLSRAVIELTESGKLSEIEGRWIKNKECDAEEKPSSISLKSFATPFGIAGGITAICIIIFLVSHLYENRDFVQRIWNSNTDIWSKVRAICKHFDQRDPKSFRSKAREDDIEEQFNASPISLVRVPRSSTVVPISSAEINGTDGDMTPSPEQTPAAHQTGSAAIHPP